MTRYAPTRRRMVTATVTRTQRLSPHYLRVTIGGPELADFEHQGFDQCFRLFFARPDQENLRMPTFSNNGWVAQFFAMSAKTRPYVRNYTVRAFRSEELELDVDFVIHGDGPASSWALSVVPGDPVGLFDEGGMYRPEPDAQWQLVVADESGVPAALAIAESTPATLSTLLALEIPSSDDALAVELGDHIRTRWCVREGPGVAPGARVLDALSEWDVPEGPGSVFIAGESRMATGLRRHFVNERQMSKSRITFFGYWRQGRGSPG